MKSKPKIIILFISGLIFVSLIFLINNKPESQATDIVKDSHVTLENGVQVVQMTESASGYSPNSFTIAKGVPVRLEVEATSDRTCASALLIPDYKIREFLKPGKNVIEFTPQKTGPIKFSCSMRMYNGVFNVI